MDDAELAAVQEVAEAETKRLSWDQSTEMLAVIYEELARLRAQIEAGIPVVMVDKTHKPRQVDSVDRPEWIRKPKNRSSEIRLTPREFFQRYAN